MGVRSGRRRFLAAAALGAAGGLTGPSVGARSAEAGPDVVWRLASSFPKSLDLMYGGAESFARTVSELTGGRFRIDVFPAGEIVPGLQVLDAVQAGTVEACQTSMDYFYGKDPVFALATAVPFGMNARQQMAFATEGGGNDLFNAFLADHKLVAFPAGNTGTQMGGFFRKQVKSTADLQGLKIRIGGLAGMVLQQLGAQPQQTPRADLYAALEQGTIDAATWVGPYDDEKLGGGDGKAALEKVAPNYYYPGWWRGGSVIHVAFDKGKFDALAPAYRAALTIAATAANSEMLARYDARNPAALKRLVVAGAELRAFPQDVLEAAFKASDEVCRDLARNNPAFRTMLDALLAFRSEEYLWWQVAEYTFDNFMIRQRAKG